MFFSLLKSPSFLSSSLKPLVKFLPNGQNSNFDRATVLGLRPKSSPVNNSYLSRFSEDHAGISAAFLSK